jgi:hypothetical protein
VQRIGLSAAPLQGEHEHCRQPLAQRMFVDQTRQLGDRVVAPASAGAHIPVAPGRRVRTVD